MLCRTTGETENYTKRKRNIQARNEAIKKLYKIGIAKQRHLDKCSVLFFGQSDFF